MSVREEEIVWSSPQDLMGNKAFNNKPYATGLVVTSSALESKDRKGIALYTYDFGGIGEIGQLQWDGTDFVSFRYKVGDTTTDLAIANYVGTDFYSFQGQTPAIAWQVEVNNLGFYQNNELVLTGTVTSPKIFNQETCLSLNTVKQQPLAFVAKMSVDRNSSSGAVSYLAVTDDQNTLEVQKVYQTVKNPAKLVGSDYQAVNTNIKNQASIQVYRNGSLVKTEGVGKVTDGIYESIDYSDIRTTRVDTIVNLKQYGFITNLNGNPTPYGVSTEAIPFRVRGDYEVEFLSFEQYIHYDIARDIGFYRATVPIRDRDIDLYESKISSWNWDGKKWTAADTDNIWKLAITLPPGTYRYNFWVDGVEVPDATNPQTYYLDKDNQKVLVSEGYGGVTPDLKGKIVFSELVVEFTQTIEFVYLNFAKQVSLIGTFNDYNPTRHLMVQQVDRQLVRRLADRNFIYTNSNRDYHRIDIELPFATNITHIDFKTLLPRDRLQRVKIFIDDKPVSQYDWTLVKASASGEITSRYGTGTEVEPCLVYGHGYGSLVNAVIIPDYSNLVYIYGELVLIYGEEISLFAGISPYANEHEVAFLGDSILVFGQVVTLFNDTAPAVCGSFYGYGYGVDVGHGYSGAIYRQGQGGTLAACGLAGHCQGSIEPLFSYWDNKTDTIVASEDDTVRWCLKPGQERIIKKVSFHSRVETGNPMRQHVLLAVGVAETQNINVSDYAFSDSYAEAQKVHSTSSDHLAAWALPTLDLQTSKVELIPTAYDSLGNPIYGDSVILAVAESRPAVWSLNRSEWAGNSIEVLYGVAGRLNYRPLAVLKATDDRVLDLTPTEQIKERFVNLGVHFETALKGIQVEPNIALWARLVGYVNTFEIRFYLTEADANSDKNALGPIVARDYGAMFPADFSGPASNKANFFELITVVYRGLTMPLLVGNIIAVYEKGGRDRVFAIAQGV